MARHRIFPLLALLLALTIGSVAALPVPALWQCRHAPQLAAAPFAARNAMPCQMGTGKMMPGRVMSCCIPKRLSQTPSRRGAQAFSTAGCNPTFVPMATLPAAILGQAQFNLHQSFADAWTLFLPSSSTVHAPIPTASRQRPPPGVGLLLSDTLHIPGLRAPPVA